MRRKRIAAPARTATVWAGWRDTPALIGTLSAAAVRGTERASFTYADSWLREGRVQIDPDLPLYRGQHHPRKGWSQFGVLEDASPDRWGRTLMQRREAQYAQAASRRPRALAPFDLLMRVHDGYRMTRQRSWTAMTATTPVTATGSTC